MVDLSGSNDPFQHGFSNSVFIIPAIVVVGLTGMWISDSMFFFIQNFDIFRLKWLKSLRRRKLFIVTFCHINALHCNDLEI